MIPTQRAYFRWEVRDPAGRLVSRGRKKRARSYVDGALKLWRGMLASETEDQTVAVTISAGTNEIWDVNVRAGDTDVVCGAMFTHGITNVTEAPIDTRGIVVGTDNTAVAMTDTALGARIEDGSGTGELEYQSDVMEQVVQGASDASIRLRKTFLNSSGASIAARECGLYVYTVQGDSDPFTTDPISAFMIMRDVISPQANIPAGNSLLVEYVLKIEV